MFDLIVAATDGVAEKIQKLHWSTDKVESFDFRVIQIQARVDSAKEKLSGFGGWDFFEKNFLTPLDLKSRIILGSAWPVDSLVAEWPDNKDLMLQHKRIGVMAAHQLGAESLKSFESSFGLPLYPLDLADANGVAVVYQKWRERPGWLWVSNKGILCELYSYFGQAYVGGGYSRSVHSLLEPFLAGCKVVCGPRTHRSTEYLLIKELDPSRLLRLEERGPEQDPFESVEFSRPLPSRELFSYRLKEILERLESLHSGS